MSYSIKEKDKEDMIGSGMAGFFDPIPSLKAWFGIEYQQRAMVAFHVGNKKAITLVSWLGHLSSLTILSLMNNTACVVRYLPTSQRTKHVYIYKAIRI